eukprot:28402-Pleurochrysis_carterae.AAC.4
MQSSPAAIVHRTRMPRRASRRACRLGACASGHAPWTRALGACAPLARSPVLSWQSTTPTVRCGHTRNPLPCSSRGTGRLADEWVSEAGTTEAPLKGRARFKSVAGTDSIKPRPPELA